MFFPYFPSWLKKKIASGVNLPKTVGRKKKYFFVDDHLKIFRLSIFQLDRFGLENLKKNAWKFFEPYRKKIGIYKIRVRTFLCVPRTHECVFLPCVKNIFFLRNQKFLGWISRNPKKKQKQTFLQKIYYLLSLGDEKDLRNY